MNTCASENRSNGPLSGLRVVDFSRILSGPYATMNLADMGAEVIKVESVGQGDETRNFPPFQGPLSHYFIAVNRSKKSVSLNLKSDEGVRIARNLVRQSDIVVENFRPGVMERLGLSYEELSADNERLIYCSITGFGTDSPMASKPAFDIVVQALSGVMSVNREPGAAPNRLGLPMGDLAGSIFAVFGILAALHERNATGRGQRVDVAMLDGLIAMLGYMAQIAFITGKPPEPLGSRHASIVPYGAFPTRDGHVIVACLSERFWRNFANALCRSDLIDDRRFAGFADRLANRAELERLIAKEMQQQDSAWWLKRLDECDVPNAPILDVAEAVDQAHVRTRKLTETVCHPDAGKLRVVRGPIGFGGHVQSAAAPPSLLGEDTASVLVDLLGIDSETLARLAAEGIIGASAGSEMHQRSDATEANGGNCQ
jgi:crotonobetainyl-CoA:carnitine CoA-transferase CaiB-like acyl-CoA transferase